MNDTDLDALEEKYKPWAKGEGTVHDALMDVIAECRRRKQRHQFSEFSAAMDRNDQERRDAP